MKQGRLLVVLTAGLACLAAALPGTALARPQTTVTQTIVDRDDDDRLEPGPGEPHLLRDDLGTPGAGPVRNRQDLLFFAQLTDSHVIDEESPLRVEFLDVFGPPFTSAYRPQEGLSPHVLNEMVRQVRNTVSPVTHRQLQLVMTTGDNTDNTQCNETRWMIDLMDGQTEVNPDSGIRGLPPANLNRCETIVEGVDPDMPADDPEPPAPNPICDAATYPDGIYHGVRGEKRYYEPDRSTPRSEDGKGYSPFRAENGEPRSIRDFPGLFENMNTPFRAVGFDKLPWYGIFGNHDGLIQGNQPRNGAFEAYAVGCAKVKGLSMPLTPDADDDGEVTPEEGQAFFAAATANVLATAANPAGNPLVAIVPPDPRRRPLKKSEYIAEHFATRGAPVGHGFTVDNILRGQGNYAFNPDGRPDLRFVVLDSIAENGGDGGNIDENQFRWLDAQLTDAEVQRQLVVVFAHHSLRTMNQGPVSEFPPGDQGGDQSEPVHFGQGPGSTQQPCDQPPGGDPPPETVKCLFLRHPGVIAFVNGHEHNNRVDPVRRLVDGKVSGGFWEINTASHIDWPQQSRVLDIVDDGNGNLSIYATILDHSAPPNPGGAPPSDGQGAAGMSVDRLASISRELSFNDPHASTDERGEGGARGARKDRNVRLVVRHPYAAG